MVIDQCPLWAALSNNSGAGKPAGVCLGSTIEFGEERAVLISQWDVRELATASHPHIHCGGSDLPCIAGRGGSRRRLN